MSNFIDIFRRNRNISFVGMRDAALTLLPADRTSRNKLYQDLERGKGILDDEDHLNMYLHSFGKMHKAKLDAAFGCIPDISEIFSEEVEIYDWGCGQGTASVCLLDFLHSKNISPNIKHFCLVEPSSAAVERATQVIESFSSAYFVKFLLTIFLKYARKSSFRRSWLKKSYFSLITSMNTLHRIASAFARIASLYFFCCVEMGLAYIYMPSERRRISSIVSGFL